MVSTRSGASNGGAMARSSAKSGVDAAKGPSNGEAKGLHGGTPVVTVRATCVDATKCPFANAAAVEFSLAAGEVAWLSGPSGVGKSTIAAEVAGLGPTAASLARDLGVRVDVAWDPAIAQRERCGAMFQQTTLIDALSVGGNVRCALAARGVRAAAAAVDAKRLVEAVGLDWARDARKMPQELSGGMARRASLALQLAQRKRAIVLDEPFTGLDAVSARAVAAELGEMRRAHGTALLLISHQPALVALVAADPREIALEPRFPRDAAAPTSASRFFDFRGQEAYRLGFRARAKAADYFWLSLPLILLAFAAAGVAISMLSADLLARLDKSVVNDGVDRVLDAEVLPLVDAMLKDESPLKKTMTKMMIKTKAKSMVGTALPKAKRVLYAYGCAKLFALELGPLLAALLLSGRIGGSYAGEVATMQATSQNKLLATLGLSARAYTLAPALAAALLAAPLLTAAGSGLAIALGGPIGDYYGLGDPENARWYWDSVKDALLPDLRCDRNWSLYRNAVELATWPLAHNAIKAAVYITEIIAVAELIARARNLAPRDVSRAITGSVVFGGLAVILGDWAFSQLLLRREWQV